MAEYSIIIAFLGIIAALIASRKSVNPEPVSDTEPAAPSNNLLNMMALAIQKQEGWKIAPPASRSVRNNNPGNVKFSSVGYLPIYEPVTKDKDGFAVFKDYQTGFLYLRNLILEKARKAPYDNLFDFFNAYAPKSDGNDPVAYAESVGAYMNVNPATFRVKQLLS